MRYFRLEENAMEHPKFLAISDGAFRLWCEGTAYCQKSLTDGLIPVKAAKGFRYYSRSRLRELLTINVPDKGPLWHEADGLYRVHDYLDWNETRERVIANRKAGKDRLDRWRADQAKKQGVTPPHETRYETPHETVCDVPSKRNGTERNGTEQPTRTSVRGFPRKAEQHPDDALALRAGTFVQETYPALYAKHRKGARYVSKPHVDFQEALELCRVWDDARLEQIATVFLTTDHQFAESGSRTIPQFRAMASWCDSRLVEAGIA